MPRVVAEPLNLRTMKNGTVMGFEILEEHTTHIIDKDGKKVEGISHVRHGRMRAANLLFHNGK